MTELENNLNELNRLIILYKYDEALNRFYDDEIITYENENPPIVGLIAYKESAKKIFYENVTNYSAELVDAIIGEDTTVCQWHYKFDHKIWGHWDKMQLSFQRWKNGKIIHEQHYYK